MGMGREGKRQRGGFFRAVSFLLSALSVPCSASDCSRHHRERAVEKLALAPRRFSSFLRHQDGMGMLSYTYALRSEGRVVVHIYPSIPSLECSLQFCPGDVDVLGIWDVRCVDG
ncbi:hypothetical protein B0H13DRAFT_2081411, partial [Mycena leptocephala]